MNKNISITLPCKIGDAVYTIERDDCPCEICEHGQEANFNIMKCYRLKKEYKCPQPIFSIENHICEGFEISGDEDGNFVISKPGEWGYEGLECFYGCNDKVYFSYKAAEFALKEIIKEQNNGGNEKDRG